MFLVCRVALLTIMTIVLARSENGDVVANDYFK